MALSPLPDELLAASFTAAIAAGSGVSRKRQRQPDVVIPSRGIRIPLHGNLAAPANLRAYTALDRTSTLTHHSGGRIWAIGLPPWLEEDWRIHVARGRSDGKPRRRNVVGHRLTLQPGEVVMYDGVRVTSPARTWLDLASLLTVEELIAAGDSVVSRPFGPTPPTPHTEFPCSMTASITRIRGRPGWTQPDARLPSASAGLK
jgi:hypothetical protein